MESNGIYIQKISNRKQKWNVQRCRMGEKKILLGDEYGRKYLINTLNITRLIFLLVNVICHWILDPIYLR